MPIINRITGKAGGKHIISAMQGDNTITCIQHYKMCVQKITAQYNGTRDWWDKILLYEFNIFN